jgi:hypothetical protein
LRGMTLRRAAAEAPCKSERREKEARSDGAGRLDFFKLASTLRIFVSETENTRNVAR